MPIRCRECERTGLPHNEHSTPEELKQRRRLAIIENATPEQRSSLLLAFLAAEAASSARLDGETICIEEDPA